MSEPVTANRRSRFLRSEAEAGTRCYLQGDSLWHFLILEGKIVQDIILPDIGGEDDH